MMVRAVAASEVESNAERYQKVPDLLSQLLDFGRPVNADAALVAQARVAAVSVPLEHEYSVVPVSALYPELHATLHVAPLASDSVMTHGELAPPVTPVPSETGSAQ